MFFTFSQNNSGGNFTVPAITVVVEASSAELANAMVGPLTGGAVYFNGVNNDRDCSCCGDRWYETYGHGSEEPEDLGSYEPYKSWAKAAGIPLRIVYYADGRVCTK